MAAAGTTGSDDDAGGRAGEGGWGWVMESRACEGERLLPSSCCWLPCWRLDPVWPMLPDFHKPEIQVLMGSLSRREERKKAFLVKGQCWQRLELGRPVPGRVGEL